MRSAGRRIPGAVLCASVAALVLAACETGLSGTSGTNTPRDLGAALDHSAVIVDPSDAGATGDAGEAGDGGDAGAGCSVSAPLVCPDPPPRFPDVQPIFTRRCLTCHDGKGQQWPLIEYQHIADWASFIRDNMIHCTMPPPDAGIPMTIEERLLILTWIRCQVPQ